jgi:Fe-S-cluster-containing dehydrogenase component
MADKAIFVDYKYCTGCHVCEISCRQELGLSLDEWGIKLTEVGPFEYGKGNWYWNYVPVPTSLCDFCEPRLQDHISKKPSCEHHCLAQCIEVIDVKDIEKRLAEAGPTSAVFLP